jgi:hypothetical protein
MVRTQKCVRSVKITEFRNVSGEGVTRVFVSKFKKRVVFYFLLSLLCVIFYSCKTDCNPLCDLFGLCTIT